ncbi:heterokaryon incompatibility protein-domain-containing protein [Apiospora arundinis]
MASTPLPRQAHHHPPKVADPLDEATTAGSDKEIILVKKAAVKVSWVTSTATTSQDAILHLRHDTAMSEAYLVLRFPNIMLREYKNGQAFFVFLAPEEIESLSFWDKVNSYQLGVRLRQPSGLVGPDCTWTGRDESVAEIERLQTLGREAACTILVPAKEVKKAQLEHFCTAVSSGSIRSLKRHYNTASLYEGHGGRRCGPVEARPPAYAHVQGADADGSQVTRRTDLECLPTYSRTPIVADSSKSPDQAAEKPFSRPPKRPRTSDTMAAEGTIAAAPCRKCDDVAHLVTQKLDEIMSQLARLTETTQRLSERIDGLELLTTAQTPRQSPPPQVDALTAALKEEFVERDDFIETVAAQVDSEMDGVSEHLEEKLKEHLLGYLDSEMEEKGAEILEAVL